MTFLEHLQAAKGNCTKAMNAYKRERRWGEAEWYDAWPKWLGDEVEEAVKVWTGPPNG